MPNVMAALTNIGVQRRKVWMTLTTRVPRIVTLSRRESR